MADPRFEIAANPAADGQGTADTGPPTLPTDTHETTRPIQARPR